MFASVLRSLSTQARWALGGASLVFLLLGAVWVAAGGKVTRSYVANLKNGRIENPGLAKLGAISGEMGFPPALWFGDAGEGRAPDDVLLAALEDGTLRSILEEALRLRPKDRRLLLGIARQISPPPRAVRTVSEERRPSEIPYLHVRPPKRVVGVGGEGDRPVARLYANRTGLLKLREQVERALAAEEGMAAEDVYRETDEAAYELVVYRAPNRKQMREPQEPERPDRSMFT